MTVEEELARLRAENEHLKREVAEARGVIAVLEQRISELEQGPDDHRQPPSFVKANRPKREG